MDNNTLNANAEEQGLSLPVSLGVLVGLSVVLGAFVGMNHYLGIQSTWLGFLLLWYWGMEKQIDFNVLITSVLPGSFIGLGTAYLIHAGPQMFGTPGLVVGLSALILVILLTLIKKLAVLVNASTFLVLCVVLIPVVGKTNADFLDYIKSIVSFAIFFGAIGWGLPRLIMYKMSKADDNS